MKKIVFTGPESSGKTTICQAIASIYQDSWVSEYAREYLIHLNRSYTEIDLLEIAKGQLAREQVIASSIQSPFLFCDTSLLVIKIWSEYKYKKCHPWIIEKLKQHLPTLYFLCSPEDVVWEADPLREHPKERACLFEIYENELQLLDVPFISLKGTLEERKQLVLKELHTMVSSSYI